MNKVHIRVALIAALLGVVGATPAEAASGNTSTKPGAAAANVITPLRLYHDDDNALNFGKFTVGTGGAVMVNASGFGSVSGTVSFVPGSVTAADQFSVTGDKNRNFSIATGSGSVSNGVKTMTFTTAPSSTEGRLNNSGKASFSVGGTLTVTGTETAGNYRGSYRATVTYD